MRAPGCLHQGVYGLSREAEVGGVTRAEGPTWPASGMPSCTQHQAEGAHHAASLSLLPTDDALYSLYAITQNQSHAGGPVGGNSTGLLQGGVAGASVVR